MATATPDIQTEKSSSLANIFAAVVIPLAFLVSLGVFLFILGDPNNFIDNNPANNPKQGNYLGIVYKGGWVVTVLMTCLITVIVFSIERMITITRAKGRGNIASFVKRVQQHLTANNLSAAKQECDRQRGSVANVVRSGLDMYELMDRQNDMSKEQRILAIQKEV
ncbi:MAG TPA: MotA/TolQ/ExbB proton channel family protein, partial [Chitinophagales bacterium]|nr:MotA/TolQ/ExbB proton channel family protein [Chitinophagales bacterium]